MIHFTVYSNKNLKWHVVGYALTDARLCRITNKLVDNDIPWVAMKDKQQYKISVPSMHTAEATKLLEYVK